MYPNLAKTIAKNQLNIFYSCKVREKKINIDLIFVYLATLALTAEP